MCGLLYSFLLKWPPLRPIPLAVASPPCQAWGNSPGLSFDRHSTPTEIEERELYAQDVMTRPGITASLYELGIRAWRRFCGRSVKIRAVGRNERQGRSMTLMLGGNKVIATAREHPCAAYHETRVMVHWSNDQPGRLADAQNLYSRLHSTQTLIHPTPEGSLQSSHARDGGQTGELRGRLLLLLGKALDAVNQALINAKLGCRILVRSLDEESDPER